VKFLDYEPPGARAYLRATRTTRGGGRLLPILMEAHMPTLLWVASDCKRLLAIGSRGCWQKRVSRY
jgi:hypothetical protein